MPGTRPTDILRVEFPMWARWFALCLVAAPLGAWSGPPYVTGVVEDADAQIIEMPVLPNAWQSRIAWMAPEGTTVKVGDTVVRLDPGSLLTNEDQARTEYERKGLESKREIAELELQILDGEIALAQAESAVRLARIDAGIPADATRKLDHDRAQLALATAEQVMVRARAQLAAKGQELEGRREVLALSVERARVNWQRMHDAIDETEIRAAKSGFFIYGENRFTGRKIFPGETHNNSTKIALVASQKDLQFRFWVHEADIHRLPVGAEIVVRSDAVPREAVGATVNWSSKQASTRTDWSQGGYFEVTAKPRETLSPSYLPGMAIMAALKAGGMPVSGTPLSFPEAARTAERGRDEHGKSATVVSSQAIAMYGQTE